MRAVSGSAERSPLTSAPELNARAAWHCGAAGCRWRRRRRAARVAPREAPSGAKLRHDDDLAVCLAVAEQANGLGAALERQPMCDERLQRALRVPLEQLVDRPTKLVRRVPT